MTYRNLLIMHLFLCSTTGAIADTSLTTLIGSRDLNQSEDVLPVAGFYVQKDLQNFTIKPEFSLLYAFDPVYEGSEYDVAIGGIYAKRFDKLNYFFGIGAAYFSGNYGDNNAKSIGIYGHGGISLTIGKTYAIGIDFRKSVDVDSIDSNGIDSGYFQYAAILEKQWK